MKCKWNDFENGDWVDLKLEMDESEMQLKLRKINSAHGFTPKSVLEEKKLILIFFCWNSYTTLFLSWLLSHKWDAYHPSNYYLTILI